LKEKRKSAGHPQTLIGKSAGRKSAKSAGHPQILIESAGHP